MRKIYLASSFLQISLFSRWSFCLQLLLLMQVQLRAQTSEVIYRINSGGGQTSNSIGVFAADNYFSPVPGYTTSTTKAIANTSNDAIYQTQRGSTTNNGTYTYNFPVSNGQYRVKLYLAEIYWTSVGKRVFDVSAENTKFLDNYDILRKVSPLTATTESFTVNVNDGELNLYFSALTGDNGKDRPQIGGLEIAKITTSTTNQAPVFASSSHSYSLPEDANPGTLVGSIKASDPNGDALTYSITSGNTNKAFAINVSTGTLTLAKRLDYHAQSAYSLKIKVVDAGGLSDNATVAVSINPGSSVPAFTSINWSTMASQPYGTHEIHGEVVNGKLYIFGGYDVNKSSWTPTKRSFRYDPNANSWQTIADLPHTPTGSNFGGITHVGTATDGTDIYFAGGYTSNSTGTGQLFGTKQVWRYNVATNNYTALPNLPQELAAGQLRYLKGKLHYMGGANKSRADIAVHYALDLDNLAAGWKTLAPLLDGTNHPGSAVYNGKIYYFGGSHHQDQATVVQKTVQIYDPVANTWIKGTPMPTGRDHISSSVVVMGNRILVLGGETAHNVKSSLVSAYTPGSNSWKELTRMPSTKAAGAAAVLNGAVFYTGGNFSKVNRKGTPVQTSTVAAINETQITEVISPESTQPLLIYPNPSKSNDKISVRIQHFPSKEKVTVSMFDLLGRMLQSTTVELTPEGNATVEMPLSTSLNQGMYMIQAKSRSFKAQTRLIKE